ncbi:MAG: excinuclease ABC subunit UvrA [Bacteroidetes bacterium]|uniref:UvrABC system protein A n=1 Tax=Candidatus Caccoplasma merdipullorum TaxID=2840718 RepID=A0A9D9E2Q9_9BACT|nr:excinuclease ABC subunit UvrA [Candidatus Caccoplasma merdipullorum]
MGGGKKYIEVHGARVNNLKNIDVTIPRNEFTVITGLSGSGKSSLAFDTIFAEGQRRYIETFSSYARYFIGALERPDVDNISGLSPVIAIEQKTVNKNPRSTVGTTTEIYDFLRLLYARAGEAYSYLTGEKMVKYGEEQILALVMERYAGKRVNILAPLVRNRKGHYKEVFENMRKKGYLYVRVDGEMREILPGMKLDRYKNHSIELVVDKLRVSAGDERRLKESLRTAMQRGEGLVMILDVDSGELRHYSRMLMDPQTGLSYSEPAPHNFSFNSPNGACPKCKGLGYVNIIDREKIMPDMTLSIYQGGILPLGKYKNILIFWQIEAICDKYGVTLKTPLNEMPAEALDDILNGTGERLVIKDHVLGASSNFFTPYEGLVKYIEMQQQSDAPSQAQKWAGQFVSVKQCDECRGMRLNREALSYKICDKGIAELARMDIAHLYKWFETLDSRLTDKQRAIAAEIIKEIKVRLKFLIDVGLDYLNLNRASATLSGGESQRIRLATQIGSRLVNVLYILDEPSIGLHQKDNIKLINSLKRLRDVGNSIIVVEHDKEMMLAADYVIDLGPAAGRLGGNVVFSGTPAEMMKADTLTAKYLNGELTIPVPEKRRKGNGKTLVLYGARGNNLKGVDLMLPLGKIICVTGVSGSGKSSLINSTLQPAISSDFYRSLREPLPYDRIEGLENIDKLVTVDQSPLGRTPRSTPATYTGVFSDIRTLFTELPESKIRGYKSGRFSFNIAGGRCETCCGNGYRNIEMNFLPDVLVPCETCHGKRYNRETLEVRYKGKSIADILDMTINRAVEFFENVPSILNKIKVLQEVGLGYIKLGQPSTTLSGGESQRVKLAAELSKRDTGNTLYLLDEPTTGLHFEDIRVLLNVLNRLADKGNTILVIEHNLDVIKTADYIIDMGPEGGDNGGRILCCGTPEEVCAKYDTYTTRYLKQELAGQQ